MSDHDHDHDHARTVKPMVDEITDFEILEIALRELCIEKGLFTAAEHRVFTEYAEQIGPTPAARLVAKAWLDPEFKKLAVTDAIAAAKEVGVDWLDPTGFGTPSDFVAFKILDDTPTVHHVIVCALCSCYPRPILGNSPEWYRTPNSVAAWCAGRDRCCPSSGYSCPTTWRCGSRTPTRSTASWSCPCARRAPTAGPRTMWPRSSPATA
jgi:Nitrile hydratase, alpha chain